MGHITDLNEINRGEIVLLMGGPAVGKTEPARMLQIEERFLAGNCYNIVMNYSGGSVKNISDAGKTWDDDLVNRCMMRHLTHHPFTTKHVLDGFPRSAGQARCIHGYAYAIRSKLIVLEIRAPFKVLQERMQKRIQECLDNGLPVRPDDNLVTHAKRTRDYESYSTQVFDYFGQQDVEVHVIDGDRPMQAVCEDVRLHVLANVSV